MSASAGPLQLLINASDSFPALQSLLFYVSGFIGAIFIGVALLDMYHLSANNGSWQGKQGPSGFGVVVKIFVGGVLLSLGEFVWLMGNTFVGSEIHQNNFDGHVSVGWYTSATSSDSSCDNAVKAVFFFISLVGQMAFIRGWILLNKFANNANRDGLAMGLTFIIGGIMCVFLPDLGRIFANTLGFRFRNYDFICTW